jgi:hypothetical protein
MAQGVLRVLILYSDSTQTLLRLYSGLLNLGLGMLRLCPGSATIAQPLLVRDMEGTPPNLPSEALFKAPSESLAQDKPDKPKRLSN